MYVTAARPLRAMISGCERTCIPLLGLQSCAAAKQVRAFAYSPPTKYPT